MLFDYYSVSVCLAFRSFSQSVCVHKMGKLSMYARNRIILRNSGQKINEIRNNLEEEGIKTSRSAVSLFLSRYKKSGRINDAPRSGRKTKLNEEKLALIDKKCARMMR